MDTQTSKNSRLIKTSTCTRSLNINIPTCATKILKNALNHIREIHYAYDLTPTLVEDAGSLHNSMLELFRRRTQRRKHRNHGDDQPPATSTHSARQLPCLPSTSTISVSHLHRHPTPFSLTGSGMDQYSSSSWRFFSSSVVFSRNGM